MKAWILSDLHIEMGLEFSLAGIPETNVCICAGDILDGRPMASIVWLVEFVAAYMPVVFVPGNHEYYRSSIKEGLANAYELAKYYGNLFLLDGDTAFLGDYRFIGATLWTDFGLHNDQRLSMAIAEDQLNDYACIKLSKTPFKRFTPQESHHLHHMAAVHIDNAYMSQPERPTVLVSHHAPSLMSVPKAFLRDALTPVFASRFESRILQYEPLLWVHGHIDEPSDYFIGKTRVICNPFGYPDEPSRKTFVPNMVIDLAKLAHE